MKKEGNEYYYEMEKGLIINWTKKTFHMWFSLEKMMKKQE